MTISIKYSGDATLYTLDSYIIHEVEVPFSTRELDYNINTSGFDLDISGTYDFESYSPENIESCVVQDGSNYFHGIAMNHTYNNKKRYWTITFFKELDVLKNERLSYYGGLEALITATSDKQLYNGSDGDGYKSVSLMWILDNMFIDAGLQSSATSVLASKIAITSKGSYSNVLFSELKVDWHMFYAMNQSIAKNPWTATGSTWDPALSPTYFEFISWFCMMFGVVIVPYSGGYRFDLQDEGSFGTTGSRVIEAETHTVKNDEVFHWAQSYNSDYTYYYDNIDNAITEQWTDATQFSTPVTWFSNLVISCEDRSLVGGADEGTMLRNSTYYINSGDATYYLTELGDCYRAIHGQEYRLTEIEVTDSSSESWQNFYLFSYKISEDERMSHITVLEVL